MQTGLMALGAGLAVGLGAIGSGLAQARIGAAAMAAIAEKPELTGRGDPDGGDSGDACHPRLRSRGNDHRPPLMALGDLFTALEAEAVEEAAELEQDARDEARAIVEQARREARCARASARRVPMRRNSNATWRSAAPPPGSPPPPRCGRRREETFRTLLTAVQARLTTLRTSGVYPELLRAVIEESLAALPKATALRVDPRDESLAIAVARTAWLAATRSRDAGDGRRRRSRRAPTAEGAQHTRGALLQLRSPPSTSLRPNIRERPAGSEHDNGEHGVASSRRRRLRLREHASARPQSVASRTRRL